MAGMMRTSSGILIRLPSLSVSNSTVTGGCAVVYRAVGSGKSTVAGALEEALHQQGVSTYLLDG
jgi:adenylylsulfate kinase-like enzyme